MKKVEVPAEIIVPILQKEITRLRAVTGGFAIGDEVYVKNIHTQIASEAKEFNGVICYKVAAFGGWIPKEMITSYSI